MNWAVIHKDQVAPFQRGCPQLFDKEDHGLAINRARHAQAGPDPLQVDSANGRDVAALVAGYCVVDPRARGRAPISAGQRQITPHLVHKDTVAQVEDLHQLAKLVALLFVPLRGDETFFLRGSWRACSARHSVDPLTARLPCATSRACNSPSVTSGCWATAARSSARSGACRSGLGPPPCRGARSSPARCRRSIFLTNVRPTLNARAMSTIVSSPCSTAATTRLRSSLG